MEDKTQTWLADSVLRKANATKDKLYSAIGCRKNDVAAVPLF